MDTSGGRLEMLNGFYGSISEDDRLDNSRHGQLEYLTTMNYIHRFLTDKGDNKSDNNGDKKADIIELGAGTGRYSVSLAKEGHRVTAVELVESNLDVLRKKGEGLDNLKAYQGDALDLSRFGDGSFDLTLALGPMYHLYDRGDIDKAISEAVRVTRNGGVIITAFLSVHAIIYNNYLNGSLRGGIEENFTKDFITRHFTEQLFTGYNVNEFEALYGGKPVRRIITAASDSVLELAEDRNDFKMSDEEFRLFAEYHLANCERRELLGASSHLLHICRKQADDETDGKSVLLENADKLHTTEPGAERIRDNLKLDGCDAVEFCKKLITAPDCVIYKQGKNWYCEKDGIRITVNSYSFTVITAHHYAVKDTQKKKSITSK